MLLLCQVFLITHVRVKPFHNPRGQHLETFSLSLLTVLAALSTFDGTISEVAAPNLLGNEHYTLSRDTIHWVQLLSLPLPFLVVFTATAKGWSKRIRKCGVVWEHYLRCFCCRKQEMRHGLEFRTHSEEEALVMPNQEEDIGYKLLPDQ